MTREQIEAWLALEGWVLSHKVDTYSTYAWRALQGDRLQLTCVRENGDVEWFEGNYSTARRNHPEGVTDLELQLIYQEIIRHEKD